MNMGTPLPIANQGKILKSHGIERVKSQWSNAKGNPQSARFDNLDFRYNQLQKNNHCFSTFYSPVLYHEF